MKILRSYIRIPPALGGMENHIKTLTDLQRSLGLEVDIAFNDGEKTHESDLQVLGSIKLYPNIKAPYAILVFYLCFIFRLLVKKDKYDCIHVHGDWSSLVLASYIKRLTSAKIMVFSIHDQLHQGFFHKTILPKLIHNIDLIFSTGHETAKELEKSSGKKVIVQPSGIKEVFFKNSENVHKSDNFTIITVANLFPKKNIELVLEIARELQQFVFLIIGEGKERKNLEKTISEHSIKNVSLLGFKTQEEVKNYYLQSHCFLLTSFAEGTPTSALEAMACGLPIVSSNAGGIKNIIKDYENGFIIESFERDEFIEKIRFLHSNEMLRETISVSNKNLAKDYRWINVANNITNRTIDCYNKKQAQ